jgi:hypothetical protein
MIRAVSRRVNRDGHAVEGSTAWRLAKSEGGAAKLVVFVRSAETAATSFEAALADPGGELARDVAELASVARLGKTTRHHHDELRAIDALETGGRGGRASSGGRPVLGVLRLDDGVYRPAGLPNVSAPGASAARRVALVAREIPQSCGESTPPRLAALA